MGSDREIWFSRTCIFQYAIVCPKRMQQQEVVYSNQVDRFSFSVVI
jgi:hypothetical protein